MAKLDYPIYDTVDLSTTAGTDHVLFQTGQGSSATRTKEQTNMRGGGEFPSSEKFTIKGIGVHVDSSSFSDDDLQGLFVLSTLTLTYNNVKLLQAPAYLFSDRNRVGGVKTEATASSFDYFGQEGMGYMLSQPILVEGGKNLSVEFHQGLAVDTANIELKVVLYGELDSPDIKA